ncbi:sugar ABC transporter ATP-binding protein [Aureimonas sp. ME7]|uniref:sugar ABC transporter ATP-binding protein n=1 Tax=Aureimonas sp. ME7 TaxID=2744252 RepID=UPI0015F9D238|nr:sugar ABC transporter ATP-binding protein [Aureimonas sp. ME7]
MAEHPLLQMKGIAKTFGAVRALRGVDLNIHAGKIHALMGENGAGKSTLMKILSGAIRADPGGRILLDGREIAIRDPVSARALGIAVIYQELSLAPNLTVWQNVSLGRETSRSGLIDASGMRARCQKILADLGVGFGPNARVSSLSIAERQLVEIARALAFDARILVMDEPTTALSSRETDKLFDLVRRLKAQGLAIIYISHRMAEVYELADRCSVLRDGNYVGTLTRDELSAERLVKMMVGRDQSDFYHKQHEAGTAFGPPMLQVENLTDGGRIQPTTLEVRAGEVVGLAGLVGSGRTELARLIYGADRRAGGEIRLEGRPAKIDGPADAVAAGLVYLPEDRKGTGLFLDMSIEDNINMTVASRDAIGPGIRRLGLSARRARDAIAKLSIRTRSARTTVGSLSGGNQQKVLLARLLETRPKVLILDEPTRGVDIGAKSDIYQLIDDLAKSGAGVLIISSELPEVVGICDRVLVMRDGAIAGTVTGAAISQEAIVAISTGNTRAEVTP